MKIGIVGAGSIGTTLSRTLSAAGHEVKVANSRGPETIDAQVLSSGARAVAVTEAVKGVDVVILSIPLNRIPAVADLFSPLPADTVVVDTSNYFPGRDSTIPAIEGGEIESHWVENQIGRPIVKAWNSILADSFARLGTPPGTPGRIALPVAADDDGDRAVGMFLVEETGFDAVDAGTIAESWRQQPGTPCYCTNLTVEQLPAALAAAEAARSPKRRDLSVAAIAERVGGSGIGPTTEYAVPLHRALFM